MFCGAVRPADGGLELALVHRPKWEDWSHPKGKLKPGESAREAALREVLEETGMSCALGPPLPTARYEVRAGRKEVSYWAAEAADGTFAPNDEVDALLWLPRLRPAPASATTGTAPWSPACWTRSACPALRDRAGPRKWRSAYGRYAPPSPGAGSPERQRGAAGTSTSRTASGAAMYSRPPPWGRMNTATACREDVTGGGGLARPTISR